MPASTAIVVTFIVILFVGFAGVLAWGRPPHRAPGLT